MALRVSNLRLPVEEPETNLPRHLARALGEKLDDLGGVRILRKALDLRDKRQLRFVYNFEVRLPQDELRVADRWAGAAHPPANVELFDEAPFAMPPCGTEP